MLVCICVYVFVCCGSSLKHHGGHIMCLHFVFVFICGCCAHRVLTHHDVLIVRSVDVFPCLCVFMCLCLFVVFCVIVDGVMKCSDTS